MKKLWLALFVISILGACESNIDGGDDSLKNGSDTVQTNHRADFIMGADISYVNQILDHGGVYKADGQQEDPYTIFADKGATTARFRLFNNPEWTRDLYGSDATKIYNGIDDVTLGIQRAQEAGMSVLLDFHYSNRWADPAHQEVPKEWADVGVEAVKDSIYSYTYKTLMHLYAQEALPEMVQVGNENNCGLVHPYGDVCGGTSWSDLGELFNSGISAVRDVEAETGSNIELMLHVAQPENVGYWFDHIINNGDVTDFDIIGISYYTPWSEVPVSQISDSIAEFRKDYNRDVLIVETAYPWTLENADSYGNIFGHNSLVDGYPATPDGQRRFMIDLVQEVKNGGGIGVFYWEPAWITSNMKDLWGTGSSWENNALFDFEGNAHSGFDYMKYDYREE